MSRTATSVKARRHRHRMGRRRSIDSCGYVYPQPQHTKMTVEYLAAAYARYRSKERQHEQT